MSIRPGPKNLRSKCNIWTKSNKAEMESRSLQIKEKYQLYLNDQAHGDKLAINIDEIDTEMATLRESLAVLPETNPDWVEISSLAAMKLSFVKDLKDLDEGFEAETPGQVHLRQDYVNRITDVDIAVKGLMQTSPDAIYIAETAQRQLELDDEKKLLVEEQKALGLGDAKAPTTS